MYPCKVTVKKGAARSFKSGGAWIYDNEVERIEGEFTNGDLVTVLDFDGYPLGNGFLNIHSKLRVRMMTRHAEQQIDEAFLRQRLLDAVRRIFCRGSRSINSATFWCSRVWRSAWTE